LFEITPVDILWSLYCWLACSIKDCMLQLSWES
jgi:hypothetical protein